MKVKVTVMMEKEIEIPDLSAEIVAQLAGKRVEAEFYNLGHRSVDYRWAEMRLVVFDKETGQKVKTDLPYRYSILDMADDIDVFADWVDHQKSLYPDLDIEDNRDDIQWDSD